MRSAELQPVRHYRQVIAVTVAVAALLGTLATTVAAQVPDTNSYWKNFTVIEKQAKRLLDGALQSCRGRSGAEAEAALREWKASLQPEKYPGSEFNPCSGSGTLVTGKTTLVASNGIAIRLSENGPLQTEWDLRARTVKLWYGGDHISFSINPISVSLLRASLVFSSTQGQYLPATATISEGQIISGLEAFWRSAHEHYPTHSMYDVALQVITGKDQGREMLLDFIRCGKSICD